MINRLFNILLILALISFIVSHLFSRQHKQFIHRIITLSAWIYLLAALLVLLWYALVA